jgi:uncharacterized protein (TIGR02147 family)
LRRLSESKQSIRSAAREIKVHEYLDYKEYLAAIYNRVKSEMASYSYLKFAEDLGFGPINMMRLIIIGDRPLTVKIAQRIATGFDLHGVERRYFTTLVDYSRERDTTQRDHLFSLLMHYKSELAPATLDPKQVKYFEEWFNPVIREMTMMQDFPGDPEWIQNRLHFPLRLDEIKRALEILTELGYIQFDAKKNRYRRSPEKIHTPLTVDSMAIVRFHQKMMEIGRESITRIPTERREIATVTAFIPESAVPELREKIQKLLDEMESRETSEGGQVYQMSVQLFPFTKI